MFKKIIRNLRAKVRSKEARNALDKLASEAKKMPPESLLPSIWEKSIADPTLFYLLATRYYFNGLSEDLRSHREYFSKNQRGFGECAFHVMWWMIFQKLRPQAILEIGVYRGQTLSLISLIQTKLDISGMVLGISPFLPAGDTVSNYLKNIDYYEDTLKNFSVFNLKSPELLRAFSTDERAVSRISSTSWDLIYIDGNHDYNVVQEDWKNCSAAVRRGGYIVLDDSGLTTSYRPPAFATGGHPGPSQLACEIDRSQFREVLQVGHNRVFEKVV